MHALGPAHLTRALVVGLQRVAARASALDARAVLPLMARVGALAVANGARSETVGGCVGRDNSSSSGGKGKALLSVACQQRLRHTRPERRHGAPAVGVLARDPLESVSGFEVGRESHAGVLKGGVRTVIRQSRCGVSVV